MDRQLAHAPLGTGTCVRDVRGRHPVRSALRGFVSRNCRLQVCWRHRRNRMPPVLATLSTPPGDAVASSEQNSNGFVDDSEFQDMAEPKQVRASDAVVQLFEAINRRDLGSVLNLLDADCVHHDLAFNEPHKGKKDVTKFYLDLLYRTPPDMKFMIEDITGGDDGKAGVMWHIQLGGVEVPMSRGVSFYRVNSEGFITYVREGPEHFVKVASAAFPMLAMGSPLIKKLAPIVQNPLEPHLFLHPKTPHDLATQLLSQFVGDGTTFSPFSVEDALKELGVKPSGEAYPNLEALLNTGHNGNVTPPATKGTSTNNVPRNSPRSPRSNGTISSVGEELLPVTPVGQENGTGNGLAANNGPPDLSGFWRKDEDASDASAYEEGMGILQLGSLQRSTARMICGVEIQHTDDAFSQHFVLSAVVPQFRVTERYKINNTVQINRRDLRAGKTTVTMTREGDALVARHEFGGTFPGKMVEEFRSPEPDVLHLLATVEAGGRSTKVLMVYKRENKSMPGMRG